VPGRSEASGRATWQRRADSTRLAVAPKETKGDLWPFDSRSTPPIRYIRESYANGGVRAEERAAVDDPLAVDRRVSRPHSSPVVLEYADRERLGKVAVRAADARQDAPATPRRNPSSTLNSQPSQRTLGQATSPAARTCRALLPGLIGDDVTPVADVNLSEGFPIA